METTKTISQFKKLFKEKQQIEIEEIPETDRKIFLEPSNVLGIIPKTINFKTAFEGIYECSDRDIPNFEYTETCKFSSYYFKIIAQILSSLDSESIELKIKKDTPLTISTKHFNIVLAPRVETD